MGVAWNTITY